MGQIASGIGDFVGNVTGQTAQNRAGDAAKSAQNSINEATDMNKAQTANIGTQLAANQGQATQAQGNAQQLYGQQQEANQATNQANAKTNDSMGANAAEEMQKANQSASANALQQANVSGGAAAASARAAGLNAGQAAQMASQGTTGAYQSQLNNGISQYGQAVNQFQGQGQNMASQASGLAGQQNQAAGQGQGYASLANQNVGQGIQQAQTQAQIAQAATGASGQQQNTANQQGSSLLGGITGAAGALFSDKNLKTDIKPASMSETLESILKNVKPMKFKYKPGVPSNQPEGTQMQGVLAQDLEKTPLKDAVIDSPEGKKIDTGQLSVHNLDLIIELASRVKALEGKRA